MSWLSRLGLKKTEAAAPASEDVTSPALEPGEVAPPWVEYPGIPPWDFFWREAGEGWRTLVWEPYYNGLSKPAQEQYLKRWKVPEDWYDSYFDEATREFWEHADDPQP